MKDYLNTNDSGFIQLVCMRITVNLKPDKNGIKPSVWIEDCDFDRSLILHIRSDNGLTLDRTVCKTTKGPLDNELIAKTVQIWNESVS